MVVNLQLIATWLIWLLDGKYNEVKYQTIRGKKDFACLIRFLDGYFDGACVLPLPEEGNKGADFAVTST